MYPVVALLNNIFVRGIPRFWDSALYEAGTRGNAAPNYYVVLAQIEDNVINETKIISTLKREIKKSE